MTMLKVASLSAHYGRHQALDNVALQIDASEIVVILGANGAGKSTLLKSVARLMPADAGAKISLQGDNLLMLAPHQVVEAGIALVPEGRGIFGDLTVQENLLLGAYARRARTTEHQRLEQVLALFPKLEQRMGQTASTMSGGEQQMVAIGRALMSNPSILLLDEPSLGLSPLMTSELFKAITQVRAMGVGVLMVEQNAKKSLAIADRAYLLGNGRVLGEGSAQAMANDPAVQAAYLGGSHQASTSVPSSTNVVAT
jgi:ABC-type branched-subunit amino acid transport system ATPase component